MNQKAIDVILKSVDLDKDVLCFKISDEKEIEINLNSKTCQVEIKQLFSELLSLSIDEEISLVLKIEDGYSKDIYKDVCTEYISDIAKELSICAKQIRQEMEIQMEAPN